MTRIDTLETLIGAINPTTPGPIIGWVLPIAKKVWSMKPFVNEKGGSA